MMNAPAKVVIRKNAAGRMPMRLAALFTASFALFFVLFFVYDLLSTFMTRTAAAAEAEIQVTSVVVDPRIAADLAKVLASEPAPIPDDVKDPFTDRAQLSGRIAQAAAPAAGVGSITVAAPVPFTGGRPSQIFSGGAPGSPVLSAAAPLPSAVAATKQRYEIWLDRLGRSGAPIDPRLFAIEDLTPVGIVDGGNGQQEVMFQSEAAGRTLSFPVGTLFYDGWLSELRPEGVLFSLADERRTVRMRMWAREPLKDG